RRARRERPSAPGRCPPSLLSQSWNEKIVVVRRAVRIGDIACEPRRRAILTVGPDGGEPAAFDRALAQRACLTRAVSSCTRLYTDLSSRIRRAIFDVAWITVVWSRPPKCLPIFGNDESVSSRERYIATCRG